MSPTSLLTTLKLDALVLPMFTLEVESYPQEHFFNLHKVLLVLSRTPKY